MEENLEQGGFNPEEIDKLLSKFFFGCNIPFTTVESVHFKNFVNKLNPAYKIPTRKTLSTTILDDRYKEFEQSIASIESRDAILLLDGWKNSAANTKNVVAMLSIDNQRYVYLKSWNFSSLRETARALTDVVNECIIISRERYNLHIYALITDNAANMICMGRLVDIWHVTCNSHSANLLCKSVVNHSLANSVNKLLKEFKSPALESQLVLEHGNRMVLIGDTRWSSHRDAFRRCLRNLNLMRQIATNQDRNQISEENYTLLLNPVFEMQLLDQILILDPICELINNCQKSDCSIATATELWLKLDTPDTINDENKRLISERIKKVINPFGLAANFLHPIYRGKCFSSNEEYINITNNFFIEMLGEENLIELQQYKDMSGSFQKLFQKNYQSSKTFWKVARLYYPNLSAIAIKLNNLCASTGQLERLFSEWAHIHSLKRNRLTPTRSEKLVALYYELRLHDNQLLEELYDDLGE